MTAPAPILCRALGSLSPRLEHGFFTRQGGVSRGIYQGLNVGLGSGDERGDVLENRARVAAQLGDSPFLATPRQTHSPDVAVVDAPWAPGEQPAADAVVTNRPGIAAGVLTADCGPVLFAEAQSGVVGAAHAGWKGATGGVLENTIAAMERLGADRSRIVATLGPTISQAKYEVGPEFVERLIALDPDNAVWLAASPRPAHAMFDLPAYILARLERAGVAAAWTGECTYADADRFFSFRRTTHRGEPDYGRQISAILIRD